jgi:ammonia channel protein AmtB
MDAGSLSNLINGKLIPGARGFDLVHCFFLTTFAACIPAIISGGIAERAKFWPQVFAGAILVGICYPLFESIIWGRNAFFQDWLISATGANSTIMPAQWSSTLWEAGLRFRPLSFSGNGLEDGQTASVWASLFPVFPI